MWNDPRTHSAPDMKTPIGFMRHTSGISRGVARDLSTSNFVSISKTFASSMCSQATQAIMQRAAHLNHFATAKVWWHLLEQVTPAMHKYFLQHLHLQSSVSDKQSVW